MKIQGKHIRCFLAVVLLIVSTFGMVAMYNNKETVKLLAFLGMFAISGIIICKDIHS